MGIEPTQDPCGPNTGFEDQGRHQTPVTSTTVSALLFYRKALALNSIF